MADQPTLALGTSAGSYQYDGNLKRVKSTVGGATIYNIYDASGALVQVDDLGTGAKTDYIKGAGMTLARIKNGNVTYLHGDHLGSAAAGANGAIEWEEHYTLYGEALNDHASNDNQAGFTDKLSVSIR